MSMGFGGESTLEEKGTIEKFKFSPRYKNKYNFK